MKYTWVHLPGQDQIQGHLLENPCSSGWPSHNHMHALPRPTQISQDVVTLYNFYHNNYSEKHKEHSLHLIQDLRLYGKNTNRITRS